MPTRPRNRFVHLEFEVDVQEWSSRPCHSEAPVLWRAEESPQLLFRPEPLSAFDRDATTFPSPRFWEFVSRILDCLDWGGKGLCPVKIRTLKSLP